MGCKYFRWFFKDMGKRPNGPRLPIDAEGGQGVLDSLLQTPLGLEDQDAPAVRKAYRRMLFSSGCSSCLNPAGPLIHLYGGMHGLRLHTQRVGVGNKRQRKAASAGNGAIAVVNDKLLRGNVRSTCF